VPVPGFLTIPCNENDWFLDSRKPHPAGLDGAFKGKAGDGLLSHNLSIAVPSALQGLTAVFGMGTGVAPAR
jgi:hypothetical protein